MATFESIIVESKGPVGIITLNRPKMLNALSFGVFRESAAAVYEQVRSFVELSDGNTARLSREQPTLIRPPPILPSGRPRCRRRPRRAS